MENLVLLARPSFFIVNDMRSFISGNGYTPKPLKAFSELNETPINQVKGVVISTAVRSDVDHTYMEVVKAVREKNPNLPIAFATLVDFDHMKKSMMLNLERFLPNPVLTNIDNYDKDTFGADKRNMFLLLHKDDISKENRIGKANRVIQSFFL